MPLDLFGVGFWLSAYVLMSLISVVVPTHNESANVQPLYQRLKMVFDGIPTDDFELIFCDDSRDSTPEEIAHLHAADPRVKLIRLSRRFGQAIAVTAGLDRASGDAVIMMDADLQDPPESIPLLLERWRIGYEIVYVQRPSESTYALYKLFSHIFYRLLRKIASVEIPVDAVPAPGSLGGSVPAKASFAAQNKTIAMPLNALTFLGT